MIHFTSKNLTFLFIILSLICFINSSIIGTDVEPCCGDNAIIVNGFGKVTVQPDIAFINVGASSTTKTSQNATKKVADQINQILLVLKKNNIRTQDIKTESISISPAYDYSNGTSKLVGQTAQQQLTVIIRKFDKSGSGLGSIIDQLVVINGIQFNGLRFDKENKTDAQKLARKLAFEDAKRKAQELALLSERALGKVLAINDLSQSLPAPNVQNFDALALKSSAGTSVPVGDQEISYNLNAKFALK